MELLTLGKEPVATDRPVGGDARYDPAFEELQAEIDKVGNPSASGGVDWGKVGKLSSEILAQKSKDLLVASYLAVSLLHTKKVEGFAIGLKVYRDLLETYWETLFPPKARMRGRVAAVEWWVEKAEAALSGVEPRALPQEAMTTLRENFDRIDELLREYLEEPPSLRPLLEYVRSLEAAMKEQAKPQEQPPGAAQPGGVATPGPAASPTPPPGAEVVPRVGSKEDVTKVLAVLKKKAQEVASYLRKEDLPNPLLYRLGRWAVWHRIESLPPATDGRTMIPSPDPNMLESIDVMRSKGNHMELVRLAEGALGSFIFWMDLNRWSAEALGALGPAFRLAADAVTHETAFFLHCFPGVEELAFADGKPFADPETRKWLKDIAFGSGGAAGATAAGSPPPEGAPGDVAGEIAAELEKGLSAVRQGRSVEVVENLHNKMLGGASGKERMLWRMALVQVLLASRQPGVAAPHAELLLKDIEGYRLEEYDPGIALQVLRLVLSACETRDDATSKGMAAAILQRLARADPAEAMRMGKGAKGR